MKLSRRSFVGGAAAGLAAAGIGRYAALRLRPRTQPNILLFIADDMRFDAAGFAGNRIVRTPHLDALARDGFVFGNHFVTTAVCPVSRASIMSGQYALRHGVYGFKTPLRPETLAHVFPVQLRRAGYYTGFVGKWGLGGALPDGQFDDWRGYAGEGEYYPHHAHHRHITDIDTDEALHFLRRRPSWQPFLLVVSYKAPHVPLQPQRRFDRLYDDALIPRAASDTPEAYLKLPPLLRQSAGRDTYREEMGTDAQYRDYMRKYYRLVTGIDDSVGQILQALGDEAGNTCVMFTSDNGMQMGAHGLAGKWCMLEESIRVPMLVRPAARFFGPYTPARVKDMTLNIDLSPTILSMAGLPLPPEVQGADLRAIMNRTPASWRQGFYYEYYPALNPDALQCTGWRGVQWKYSRYKLGQAVNECLFDIAADASEMNDLANLPAYQDRLKELRQLAETEKKALA